MEKPLKDKEGKLQVNVDTKLQIFLEEYLRKQFVIPESEKVKDLVEFCQAEPDFG